MKNYLQLASAHAHYSRRENRMTVLCIMLAVFLVTSVFSMVDFEYRHMYEKLVRDHGNWHIMLTGISKEEAENLWDEADVAAYCRYDTLNYEQDEPIYLDSKPICVIGTEKSFFSELMTDMLLEGHFPVTDSEILLNNNVKDIFDYSIGDTVTIAVPKREFYYTVCGFFKDTSKSLEEEAIIGIMNPGAFEKIAAACNQQWEPTFYVQFEKSLAIKNTITHLKTTHGWTEGQVSENTAVLGILGMSSSNYIAGLYGVAALLAVVVIAAGVMMISGSMNTGVARRTQYFGMLRCIGASKRQIRRIVRLEALNRLKAAMPMGLGASVLACWMVCAALAYGIGGEWSGMPVGEISFVGIALGILVGFLTVLLAASTPAKRASKVSPVAASTGVSEGKYSGAALRLGVFSLPVSLGIHHAVSGKKTFFLLIGSFALSIVLFLSFSVMTVWIENALTSNKPYSPDLSVYYSDYRPALSRELARKLRETGGVKCSYGRMYRQLQAQSGESYGSIDLISYDEPQFDWAEEALIRGDISKVRNVSGCVMVVFDKGTAFNVDDTIELNGKILTVSALLSESPFSASDIPTVICSEKTFEDFTGGNVYSVIDIQLEKDAGEETVAKIRAQLDEEMTLSDRRAGKTEANSTYLAFTVLVYGFLALVVLIAVFNIINSISLSVTSRRRQYGMMRAVGLGKRGLVKMIAAEALCFALSGCIVGCAVGLTLNAVLYRAIITNYWGVEWKVPWTQMLAIVPVVLFSSLLAVYGPAKHLSKVSIADTINT